MRRTYLSPPDVSKYPKWMREYLLTPTSSRTSLMEYEKALLLIHENKRVNPVSTIIFENTMGMIRLRHHVTELCIKHEDVIDTLEKKIATMEKHLASARLEIHRLKRDIS